jgi:hypothetical protein
VAAGALATLAVGLAGAGAAALATYSYSVVLAVSAVLASSTVLTSSHFFYIKAQYFFRARRGLEKSYNVKWLNPPLLPE